MTTTETKATYAPNTIGYPGAACQTQRHDHPPDAPRRPRPRCARHPRAWHGVWMRPKDDCGDVMNAVYSVQQDVTGLTLILESGGGKPRKDAPQGARRNADYDQALQVLLGRLRDMDAILVNAVVDSATARNAVPESERRLLDAPLKLLEEPGIDDIYQHLKRRQRNIGQSADGNRQRRIKMHLIVPYYGPHDAGLLESRLATSPLSELLPASPLGSVQAVDGKPIPTVFAGALERMGLAPHRGEQANLRLLLMPATASSGVCALCGLDLPSRMLTAAHIKRRKDCDAAERRDLANIGMLACLLGCDALYEHGYISVANKGILLTSQAVEETPSLAFHVRSRITGQTTPWWRESREKYYAWHRSTIYRGG
jgi:hypothetical protein